MALNSLVEISLGDADDSQTPAIKRSNASAGSQSATSQPTSTAQNSNVTEKLALQTNHNESRFEEDRSSTDESDTESPSNPLKFDTF